MSVCIDLTTINSVLCVTEKSYSSGEECPYVCLEAAFRFLYLTPERFSWKMGSLRLTE